MAGKNKFSTTWYVLNFAGLFLFASALSSCDRGASQEVGVARKFADAVAKNDATARDSMIATYKFKDFFTNPYVAHDVQTWFRSFYDPKAGKFRDGI